MPDTGFVIAGTGSDDASVGTLAWNNPGNITSDDGVYAGMIINNQQSHYLRASNFGFTLPADTVVDGIEVRIQKHQSGGTGITDTSIRLFDASASVAGDNKSTGAAWSTTAETVVTYGGPTDLWGLTPTKADVEDVDWGWGISASCGLPARTSNVDVMEMKIYYSDAPPTMAQFPEFRLPEVM